MDPAHLASLRLCEKPDCVYAVTNALVDFKDILHAMSNHIAAIHPSTQPEGGGGASKSTASIPMLEENITETQWAAWKARFDCYCVACKLSDKNIENCVFECIPSSLADQIVVDLTGDETKMALLIKIKAVVVKKRSIFCYIGRTSTS